MNKKMKKIFALILTLTLLFTITGCGGNNDEEEAFPYTIGIDFYGDSPALSACRKGMMEALEAEDIVKDENLKVISKNAQCNKENAAQNSESIIAQNADIICAFSTPMAQIALEAAKDSDTSVIFAGVSDPKAAGLSKGNITGLCIPLPVEKQLQLIREMLPQAVNIGILYCEDEDNSKTALNTYQELAEQYGFTIVASPIKEVNDIPLAADKLLLQVDCVAAIGDNTVASSLSTVLKKAELLGIPVFGTEIEQVKDGCIAAYGPDYYKAGLKLGEMVAKVLRDDIKAKEMKDITVSDAEIYYNPDVMETLNLTLPESIADTAINMNDFDEE